MRSSVHSARQAAGALRTALLAPSLDGIDAAMPALQLAAASLEQLRGQSPDAVCRAELEVLSRELRAVARLAGQGFELARGTMRLLTAGSTGYQPDGEPALPAGTGSVLVRG